MSDKSPRTSKSKKSDVTLKQKRALKKAAAETTSGMEKLTQPKRG